MNASSRRADKIDAKSGLFPPFLECAIIDNLTENPAICFHLEHHLLSAAKGQQQTGEQVAERIGTDGQGQKAFTSELAGAVTELAKAVGEGPNLLHVIHRKLVNTTFKQRIPKVSQFIQYKMNIIKSFSYLFGGCGMGNGSRMLTVEVGTEGQVAKLACLQKELRREEFVLVQESGAEPQLAQNVAAKSIPAGRCPHVVVLQKRGAGL